MGDGFVSGELHGAGERFRGVNGLSFHDKSEFSMARKAGSMWEGIPDIRYRISGRRRWRIWEIGGLRVKELRGVRVQERRNPGAQPGMAVPPEAVVVRELACTGGQLGD
jgi:hypothetical protein